MTASASTPAPSPLPPFSRLTPREQDIARMVIDGLRSREIAARLGTREQTVKNQKQVMFAKLGINRSAQIYAALGYPTEYRCGAQGAD